MQVRCFLCDTIFTPSLDPDGVPNGAVIGYNGYDFDFCRECLTRHTPSCFYLVEAATATTEDEND